MDVSAHFVYIRCMFKIIEQTVGTMISVLYFSVCLVLMNINKMF